MSMHTVGISTAIMIPIVALSLVGFIWWNSELTKIALGKNIQIYNHQTSIEYVQWIPQPNQTYSLQLTVKNNGTYPTQIKMINQPNLPTYSLIWNYKGQTLELNQTIPLLLELRTTPEFTENEITTFIEVIK